MLKKRVLKRLLPLLFSFCCVFSGFLSVNAFADVIHNIPYNSYVRASSTDTFQYYNGNWSASLSSNKIVGSTVEYNVGNIDMSRFQIIYSGTDIEGFTIPYNPTKDYYFAFFAWSVFETENVLPTNIEIYHSENSSFIPYQKSNVSYGLNSYQDYCNGFYATFKIDNLNVNNTIRGVRVFLPSTVTSDLYCDFTSLVFEVEKDTSQESVNAIVNAINNQTNQLSSDIGQAADDIQQSIEDQYNGDPEEEFSVEDVITQHNEKMGVLSFGSDVMLQFLDMFQSANVGTAELTLPGFNITVENVEYSVWPDYSFNFEQLNEWVPALMSVIRVMLPAFVWLMVLRYCIKVFEDNFLAK